MKKGYKKCVSCEKFFDFESVGYFVERGDDEGKPICDVCYSEDSSEPEATVVYLDGRGERVTSYVGAYAVHGECDESELPVVYKYADKLGWSGFGWRGSYNGEAPEGWVRVFDSWFGTIDGHNIDGDLEKFRAKFEDGEDREEPDFPVLAAFPRTSNVCACGIEVYVPGVYEDKFWKWVRK